MGRVRLPLRRRSSFSFWKGRQGRLTPPIPPLTGWWGIQNPIDVELDGDPAAYGWYKLTADTTALLTTTDKAALDITGDICLVACIRPTVIASGTTQRIFGKWGSSGQFAYGLGLSTGGLIQLTFSTNGTSISVESSGATAPLSNLLEDGEKFWIAAAMDANNGASGRTKKYWWRREGDPNWTQLGVTQTSTPNQSIFSGSGDVGIGRFPGDTASGFQGWIYNIEIYDGIGTFTTPGEGTLVAAAEMREPWSGGTYDDGIGNTWTETTGSSQWSLDPIYRTYWDPGSPGSGPRFPVIVNDSKFMVPFGDTDGASLWRYDRGGAIAKLGEITTTAQLDGARAAVMSADNKYAFTVSLEGDYFATVDVTGDVPRVVASIQDTTNLNGARSIVRKGDYCYVTARDGARVTSVNVSNPLSPSVAHSVTHANLTDCRGIAVHPTEDYVIVACDSVDRITSVNISDPNSLTYGSSVQDTTHLDGAHELVLYNNGGTVAALVACVNSPGRIAPLDVTDPMAMIPNGSYTLGTLTQSAYDIAIDYALGKMFVVNLDLGWITIWDVTPAPGDIQFQFAFRPATTGGGLAYDEASRTLVFVSYDESIVETLRVTGTS